MDFFFCYSPTWDKNLAVLVCRIFFIEAWISTRIFCLFWIPPPSQLWERNSEPRHIYLDVWYLIFLKSTTVNTQLPKVIDFYQTDSPSQESTAKNSPFNEFTGRKSHSPKSMPWKNLLKSPSGEKVLKTMSVNASV